VPPDPNSLCWALRSTPSCGGTAQGGKEGTGRLTFTCADGSMKLRVRTADGGTLRVEADKTCSVCSFVAQLELPPGQEASRADLGLSLNKKDLLNPDTTLEANGIRGGDLVHLVSMAGYGGIGSPSRPGQAAAAAAAAPAASAARLRPAPRLPRHRRAPICLVCRPQRPRRMRKAVQLLPWCGTRQDASGRNRWCQPRALLLMPVVRLS